MMRMIYKQFTVQTHGLTTEKLTKGSHHHLYFHRCQPLLVLAHLSWAHLQAMTEFSIHQDRQYLPPLPYVITAINIECPSIFLLAPSARRSFRSPRLLMSEMSAPSSYSCRAFSLCRPEALPLQRTPTRGRNRSGGEGKRDALERVVPPNSPEVLLDHMAERPPPRAGPARLLPAPLDTQPLHAREDRPGRQGPSLVLPNVQLTCNCRPSCLQNKGCYSSGILTPFLRGSK